MRLKRWLAAVAALIAGGILLPSAASAANTGTCGMTGAGAVGSTAIYDPFNPSGLGTTSIDLTLTRYNPPGGSRTEHVRFILRAQSAASNGITITPVQIVTGQANLESPLVNVFYNFGSPGPVLSGTPSAGNRFAHIEFTGNNSGSDTVTVRFTVTFPANLNIQASQNLSFDMDYTCTTQPAGGDGGGTIPNALTFPIRVLSGLQASYVGPALNFGEVGDKTDAQAVLLDPAAGLSKIRVASSGPYTISMASANGYRMTYSGGNPALENQNLRYTATFLGSTGSPASPGAITKTCTVAGLGSPPLSAGRDHPLTVQLQEGGLDGTPEVPGNYSDTLTFTITPLVAGSPGVTCP